MNEIINEIHKNINKSNNNRNFQKEMDRLIEKINAQEQEDSAPYVKLIKKLALEDRIDFEAAKLLISTYRREKNEENK